ncbi:hypothetical protein RchiOBHm_Chr7g0231341 [Rosa chinensis]|uniref:Uncharacterized protein n=1 Tax=Rosa chinensis TaxID=74649 RepID=A0A2P6PFM6_ROSCH|nr:hypothetical protein RchiOBHm_Chr7g0231341 [Rosa chinensis]
MFTGSVLRLRCCVVCLTTARQRFCCCLSRFLFLFYVFFGYRSAWHFLAW